MVPERKSTRRLGKAIKSTRISIEEIIFPNRMITSNKKRARVVPTPTSSLFQYHKNLDIYLSVC